MKTVRFKKKTDRWFKNEVVTLTDDEADEAIAKKEAVVFTAAAEKEEKVKG